MVEGFSYFHERISFNLVRWSFNDFSFLQSLVKQGQMKSAKRLAKQLQVWLPEAWMENLDFFSGGLDLEVAQLAFGRFAWTVGHQVLTLLGLGEGNDIPDTLTVA
jgi:hypothetical protein